MFWIILPVALILTTALLFAACSHSRFSDHIAPLLLCIMLLLYGFYIFDLLPLGRILLLSLLTVCIFLFLIFLLRNQNGRQQLKQVLFSTDFICFLIGVVFCFLFSTGKQVGLFDELRLWAAYPKVLYATESLQLGDNSYLFPSMQSYPPGMPLLCYFFTKFCPFFPEDSLYFLYAFFALSLMVPLIGGIAKENRKGLVIVFLSIVFLPWFLSSVIDDGATFYISLFIDIPLGLCCGYAFYHGFKRFGCSIMDNCHFTLSLCALVLLKDSGAFMAVFGILAAASTLYFHRKERLHRKNIAWLIICICLIVLCWYSWRWLCNTHSISNHLHLNITLPSLSVLFRIAYRFLTTPVLSILLPVGTFSFSLPFMLLVVFTSRCLLCRFASPETMRQELIGIAIECLCYGGFYLGYCFLFLEQIQETAFPSYSRYMSTLVFCTAYIGGAEYISHYQDFLIKSTEMLHKHFAVSSRTTQLLSCVRKGLFMLTAVSLLMAAVLIRFDTHTPDNGFLASAENTAQIATENIEPAYHNDCADLYLCTPGDQSETGLFRHRTYFNLLDDNIRIPNFYDENNILSDQFPYTQESLMAFWLKEGYDYVLLTWSDPLLREKFPYLFPDEGTNMLYRIDRATSSLVLIAKDCQ